jgi:DNA-directed RNA polymerase specialized sigma24 family protein
MRERRTSRSALHENGRMLMPRDARRFATTRWTLVLTARDASSPDARQALEALCAQYWYPLYAFLRRQGYDAEKAQDLTQGFFARLLEKHYLDDVRPERGRFRTFLLTSLKHFAPEVRCTQRSASDMQDGGRIGRRARLELRPRPEHADQARDAACSREVLERVAADDLTEREDRRIGNLQSFGCGICGETGDQVSTTWITRRVEDQHEDDYEQRAELHEQVRTQIARTLDFTPIPVADAGRADRKQWREEPAPHRKTYPLCQYRRQEPHEPQRHRQSIPDQARVVGDEMVIARSKSREGDASKERRIRPPLPRLLKSHATVDAGSEDCGQPQHSNNSERQI